MTTTEGRKLLTHLKSKYEVIKDVVEILSWEDFTNELIKSNNENNGSAEDLLFVCEDAIEKLKKLNDD